MKVPNPRLDDDGAVLDVAVEERHEQQDREEHEQPAPQHVGDVEARAAELRVAGDREEEPDPEE